jgi:hypothetical protein
MLPRKRSSKRPERNPFYKFSMRRCCACTTRSRLVNWNPIPPDTSERCYACQHENCDRCVDFWGRRDERSRAVDEFIDFHNEKCQKMEKERTEVAQCVVEIIERHSKIE